MIKNIIFDMGGVLIRWKPEEMLYGFDLSPEEMKIINRELFKGIEWVQQDRGVISDDALLESAVPVPHTRYGGAGGGAEGQRLSPLSAFKCQCGSAGVFPQSSRFGML